MAGNDRTRVVVVFVIVDVLITLVFLAAWFSGRMRLVEAVTAAAVLWSVNAMIFAKRLRRVSAEAAKAANAPIEPQ